MTTQQIKMTAKELCSYYNRNKAILEYPPYFTPSRCGEEFVIVHFSCRGNAEEICGKEIKEISAILERCGIEIESVKILREKVGWKIKPS